METLARAELGRPEYGQHPAPCGTAVECSGFLAAMGPAKGSNERLQTFRNFVAHRGRKSALKVRDLARQAGLLVSGDPLELLFHRAPKRPVSVFTEWIIELRSVVELLPR